MSIFNMVYGKKQNRWEPWSDVFFWLPLKEDVKDYSGNNRHGTLTWSWTYEHNGLTLPKWNYITCVNPWNQSKFTMSMYLKINNAIAWWPFWRYYYNVYGWWYEWSDANSWSVIWYSFPNNSHSLPLRLQWASVWWGWNLYKDFNSWLDSWYNIIYTWDNGTVKLYINWELVWTKTWCTRWVVTNQSLFVNNFANWWGNDVSVWDIIFATDVRDQAYITNYVRSTIEDYILN